MNIEELNLHRPSVRLLFKHSEYGLAIGVVLILSVLIIPLPTFLLDILITVNISLSFLVLLVALHVKKALEISAFPSLLLFLTLFRLALNVASTRLILMRADAGDVIASFGNYVVGGNVVIGLVIFLILTVIQFIVITKGATRVSEVAARFTLDAMPGKQMSIDADLNSGVITEGEARERRNDIAHEAEFYGSMDGAGKFVSGDAIAGIIITLVNIAGGMIIGGLMQGMKISDALSTYTILTVGDGLVSQIPSLINATSAALLITKASSKSSLGRELSSQLLSIPRATAFAAGILGFFSLIPGLPKIPFLMLSGFLGLMYYVTRKHSAKVAMETDAKEQKVKKVKEKQESEEDFEALLQVDRMGIEVGYKLVNLVDPKKTGGILNRIGSLRKQLVRELGIIIPPIRLRDNLQLPPNEYHIKIKGQTVAKGEILPDSCLALGGDGQKPIEGVATTDPAYGLPSVWIPESKKESAESAGYTVIDPTSVLMTHLTEIIKSHSHEIMTREDIQKLIDNLKKDSPTLVNEFTPNVLTLGAVQEVVRNLLRERASIRDFSTILETLIDYASSTKDPEVLTEYVRQRLCRTLCGQYQDEANKISTISFEPSLEQEIVNSLQTAGNKSLLALEPNYAQRIIDSIATTMKKTYASSSNIVFLTSSTLRNHIRKLTENALPYLPVLSYKEIAPGIKIESLGVVSISNEN